MAGTVMTLFNKRPFNFDQLTAGQTEKQVLIKALDVSAYREGMLVVRAHTRDIVNASSKIDIVAYVTAPTDEEPQTDFNLAAAAATASVPSGSTAVLITANLANFGGFLRIEVQGTRVTSGNVNGNISADIVLKE